MRHFNPRFSNRECGDYLIQRGVTRLIHITRVENLANILKVGLLPIASTERARKLHLSIQYPNVMLFSKKRSRDYFAVLVSPLLASREDAGFTQSTSASPREIVLTGKPGIKSLFEPLKGELTRKESCPANMPTSLMAEVIFRKDIPSVEITGFVFPNLDVVQKYEATYGSIPPAINWKADEELSNEEKVFSFWKDVGTDIGYYNWIHQFVDHERLRPRAL
jgi:hypothetical protein